MHEPVVILAAHPDDETIGCGGIMPLLQNLLLVHLTDGAPRNLADAASHGFGTAPAYAAARRAELRAALRTGGIAPRLACLGAADQGASYCMPALAAALQRELAGFGARALLTHPYEGGHPDHDTAALIAAHVAARAGVPLFEFASYHAIPGGLRVQHFLPGDPGITVALSAAAQRRKRAMLGCFTTQQRTLAPFGTAHERFRPAPHYAFANPPHSLLLYEQFEWGIAGAAWRAQAAALLNG